MEIAESNELARVTVSQARRARGPEPPSRECEPPPAPSPPPRRRFLAWLPSRARPRAPPADGAGAVCAQALEHGRANGGALCERTLRQMVRACPELFVLAPVR